MGEKPLRHWCKYYGSEILRYEDCFACPHPHQVFSNYISCHNITNKYDRTVNIILPKDSFGTPAIDFDNKTILIHRGGGGLGDLLMITIAVKALKRKYPNSTIIFQAAPQYIPVLENNIYINKVIGLNTDLKSDIKIDLSNPCPAMNYEARHSPEIKKHRIDIFCDFFQITSTNKKPVFVLTQDEVKYAKEFLYQRGFLGKKKIGIALRSNELKRDWPRQYNLQLIDLLIKNGFSPVIFDAEADNAVYKNNVLNICGLNIRFVASILNFCNLLICPDCGLAHLAGALDIKILGLFGPTVPELRLSTYNADWIWLKDACKKKGMSWLWEIFLCTNRSKDGSESACRCKASRRIIIPISNDKPI